MKQLVSLFFSLVIFLTLPIVAFAQPGPYDTVNPPAQTGAIRLGNPLTVETPQQLIGQIINSVLGVVGSLALLMFVYGGITWMTSSGNQEKIKKGRDIIVWAVIGLAIVFSAYGLTRVIIMGVGAK